MIGPTNLDTVVINGVPASTLIDSGSQVTTVSSSFISSHPSLCILSPTPSPVQIRGAGSHPLAHGGVILLEVECLGRTYSKVPAFIVPPGSYGPGVDALIGTNLIRLAQQDQVRLHGSTYLQVVERQNKAWSAACSAIESRRPGDARGNLGIAVHRGRGRRIEPGSEVEVMCQVARNCPSCTAIVEPIGHSTKGSRMMVGRTLVDASPGCYIPIRVLNVSDRPITIGKNVPLAQLFLVCAIEEASKDQLTPPSGPSPLLAQTSASFPELDLASSPITPEEKLRLEHLLAEYSDVFSQHDFDYGLAKDIEHDIPLVDEDPFRLPYRRIPPAQFQEVRRHIQEMEQAGVIKKSHSPYASPIVVVRKKDDSIRLCIDYRHLNSKTRRDAFPMPRIDEALDALGNAKYFTTLDLTSGYWQVKVAEKDRPKTAFTTPMGLFECIRMPFGLQNAPATFQRLMTSCLGDQQFESLLIYLDDIIVFSSSFEDHLNRLTLVFNRLRQQGLKLKPRKCHLLQTKVKYLGHVISQEGIETDPEKTSSVTDWPRPKNSKDVRRFLGFTGYYRRFVPGYAKTAKPLFQLTEGGGRRKATRKPLPPFNWTEECEAAFELLKSKLTSPPVLGFPDFETPFLLEVDASGSGLGAVISQLQDGKKRVIAFASKALTPSESKYPAHKLEFLGLKWAVVDKFREYLLGRRFHVLTDNNPLLYVTSSAKLDATGQRWVAALADFDFSVEYRSGRLNAAADALSRLPEASAGVPTQDVQVDCSHLAVSAVLQGGLQPSGFVHPTALQLAAGASNPGNQGESETGTPSIDIIPVETIARQQRSDPDLSVVMPYVERGSKPTKQEFQVCSPDAKLILRQYQRLELKSGVLHRRYQDSAGTLRHQLLLPRCHHKLVLGHLHDDVGHPGAERTLDNLRQRFFWARMAQDVHAWCTTCRRCCLRKTPTSGNRAPLSSIHTSEPLELVCIDFLKLDKSKGGYENVLVVTDHFTRYAQAYPTRDQLATTVAKTLWDNFFVHYGFPRRIHADQGRNFESHLIAELCKVAGIKKSRTTAYHPQGNGTTERFNRTLINMVGTLDPSQKASWKDHLGHLTHAYNATKHESTGYAPFHLMFGRHPNLPVDVIFGIPSQSEDEGYDDYVTRFREGLRSAYDLAAGKSRLAKDRQKVQFDKKAKLTSLLPGDRVLVMDKSTGGQKLADKWESTPYIVLSKHPELPVYVVQRPDTKRERTVHRNLLTPCMFLPLEETAPKPNIATNRPKADQTEGPKMESSHNEETEDLLLRVPEVIGPARAHHDRHQETGRVPILPEGVEYPQRPAEDPPSIIDLTPADPPIDPPPITDPHPIDDLPSSDDLPLADNPAPCDDSSHAHEPPLSNNQHPLDNLPSSGEQTPTEDLDHGTPIRRSGRTRRPVERLQYNTLGHLLNLSVYQTKLEAGKKLWARWKSPGMNIARAKLGMA